MVTEKVNEKQKQSEEEISSESDDSEIEFNYNDEDDDDDSCEDENDDMKKQDTESEESETMETPSPRKKKRKNQKTDKLRNDDDDDDGDDSNDAGDEDDDDDDIKNDSKIISKQPRKKKRKMTKSSNTDILSEDEDVSDDDDDDDESEEEVSQDEDDDEEEASENDEKEEEASENDDEEEEEEEKVRTGFANVLSNILSKKTVSSKKVILAQGKTDREIMKHKENQIPLEERESKEPVLTTEELEEQKLKRKVWLEMSRVKPNPLERNREKELKMIATRGVVQLFNAVKKQQKMMTENLSNVSSERKRDLVIESMNKKSFINLLQNTKVDVSLQPVEKEKTDAKESERKIWNVLKDDFVIGTGKMKDWDKQDNLEDL